MHAVLSLGGISLLRREMKMLLRVIYIEPEAINNEVIERF